MHLNGMYVVILLLQIISQVRTLFNFPVPESIRTPQLSDLWIDQNQYSVPVIPDSMYDYDPDFIERDIPTQLIDLRGLYATLKEHPTLMDRRLQIGQSPPPLPSPSVKHKRNRAYPKRSFGFDMGLAEPSCPFRTEWVRLRHARDINNTRVEVFQPSDNSNRYQWFYTVSCDENTLFSENDNCPYCCRGTNTRRYTSRCVSRKSYVMALIRHSPPQEFDWGYIQVDSSCNCALLPKL